MALLLVPVAGGRYAAAEERREVPQALSERLATATLLGAADPEAVLPVSITLQLQHRAELDALLAAQQRPGSADYHHWLTPEEFSARFAPPEAAYAALADWLRQTGVAVSPTSSRLRIDGIGTAAQVEGAFQVHLNHYRHRDRDVLATADTPTLPARFADLVQSARLSSFPLTHPLVQVTVADKNINTMAPDDIYTAYNVAPVLANGIDGSGQTIAVVGRSDFNLSDVSAFQRNFGVPVHAPRKVFPNGNPGIGSPHGACANISNQTDRQTCIRREEGEVVLDTEWSSALAPGASVLVDISDRDIDVSLADVVTHHPEAKIVTVSFGVCERSGGAALQMLEPIYVQAAAQGQTVLIATGDDGADGCDDGGPASVNALASDANVTAVGGTALDPGFDPSGAATGYVGETVWNDQGASGGGASILVVKPAYQQGPGVPADGFRDQPDVALLASPSNSGYVITLENKLAIVGGTSVATPCWAGIVALANDAAQSDGLGPINDALYQLGREQYAEGGAAVFHDVTVGNTTFKGVTGFTAGVGYDLATGWGSPDVALLTQAIAALTAPTPTPSPTPSTPLPCIGDCDANGRITIDELVAGVSIVLGSEPVGACPSFDCNGNGQVTIDCLVDAVNAALSGCVAAP